MLRTAHCARLSAFHQCMPPGAGRGARPRPGAVLVAGGAPARAQAERLAPLGLRRARHAAPHRYRRGLPCELDPPRLAMERLHVRAALCRAAAAAAARRPARAGAARHDARSGAARRRRAHRGLLQRRMARALLGHLERRPRPRLPAALRRLLRAPPRRRHRRRRAATATTAQPPAALPPPPRPLPLVASPQTQAIRQGAACVATDCQGWCSEHYRESHCSNCKCQCPFCERASGHKSHL